MSQKKPPQSASGASGLVTTRLTFPLGRIVSTPGALAALGHAGQLPVEFLARHAARDWGDLDAEDRRLNDYDVDHGGQLLSAYTLTDGTHIWIITEHDRSVTTILLPEEY